MGWKLYGDIAFYACAFTNLTFCILYCALAPWWRTATGRNIMTVMGSLAIALGYFSWAISIGGTPPGFYPVRALLFTSIAAAIGWRIVMFVRQHLIRSLHKEERTENNVGNSR